VLDTSVRGWWAPGLSGPLVLGRTVIVLRHTAAVPTGLLTVAGPAACALAAAGPEVSAAAVLGGVILLGVADLPVRLAVLRRRAA
jgi:hypothetical protein